MPNDIRDLREVTVDDENGLIFEKNVSIPLKISELPIRCNVYRPIDSDKGQKYPVLVTYGPYGKDIWYGDFHAKSYSDVPDEHRSKYAAWETPEPTFWTKNGYAVVRADERGLGQSPGLLDTMSRGTSECFFDVVEWAASQPWSSGKVGLLGISYYAGSQWRVAARRPKGLAAIVPWEGMSDYYRDRCRHGGIFSNEFIRFWWNRQVITNQYGRPGRASDKWGEDTIEGDLSQDELSIANCQDQNIDNERNRFRNDDYYASKEYNLEDIEVPVLSVANWGGILLHLRGNVQGYLWAGSKHKFLRFIVGRHDLPFYYPEEVAVQRSFLDAFLKGQDDQGWTTGQVPPVSLRLRKGDVGFNNPKGEKTFPIRDENEWPIKRTQYTKYYLDSDLGLAPSFSDTNKDAVVSYKALGSLKDPQLVQFTTTAFETEIEITGHIVAHLNISVEMAEAVQDPDIDVFVTVRHLSPEGKEVFYTGSSGDNVPVCKGWLRVSLRKVNEDHPKNRPWLPLREYLSSDVQPVTNKEIYPVDIELWPTNVVVEKGGKLIFEISSGDTQGCGLFQHTNAVDRSASVFAGTNFIHFGDQYENYITLPVIPPRH
ncbi:PepX-C domain-containing protein [Fusarium falciforme]|uniref:PepX-C domain-containing protein n=1 Tax=Fusarium falciforme TaxID=195108 RepID=UPI0023012426|nr:PepX-C domain-containing protein [Fusarium falciforme]WAO90181.1 PepX-C domain-containing protein [Fusarium falciforme]